MFSVYFENYMIMKDGFCTYEQAEQYILDNPMNYKGEARIIDWSKY